MYVSAATNIIHLLPPSRCLYTSSYVCAVCIFCILVYVSLCLYLSASVQIDVGIQETVPMHVISDCFTAIHTDRYSHTAAAGTTPPSPATYPDGAARPGPRDADQVCWMYVLFILMYRRVKYVYMTIYWVMQTVYQLFLVLRTHVSCTILILMQVYSNIVNRCCFFSVLFAYLRISVLVPLIQVCVQSAYIILVSETLPMHLLCLYASPHFVCLLIQTADWSFEVRGDTDTMHGLLDTPLIECVLFYVLDI